MTKYIFPHPMLLIGGQIFSVLTCFTLLTLLYQTVFNFESIGIVGIIVTVIYVLLSIFYYKTLWPQIFGILKITENYIVFFGLFLPIVKIKFNEVKYMDIRTFNEGNVMYGKKYDRGFLYKYILLSEMPLPSRRIDKICTSRSKKIIKYALSLKLCNALVDKLPKRFSKPIEYHIHLSRNAK